MAKQKQNIGTGILKATKYFVIKTENNTLSFGVEFTNGENIVIHFLSSLN